MRIVQVCPYDIARQGGVQRHIIDLSRALAREGHEVSIIAPAPCVQGAADPAHDRAPRRYAVGRCVAWRMHGTAFELTWASGAAIASVIGEINVRRLDVVHFHSPHVPFMPWQFLRALANAPARRVATFHDTPPDTASGALARRIFGYMSRRLSSGMDAMIAVSHSAAAHLRPQAPCSIRVLPPCIDLRACATVETAAGEAAETRVLFVGRLEPRKGALIAIAAFGLLRKTHPHARLIVCGDGEQRRAAEQRVRALKLGDRVEFAGALDEDAKLKLFAQADVLCAPSPYGESYGLVLAEAMAAGVPIVAAANRGYRSVLTGDGAAGLVQPNSATALAERLAQVLGSPELRMRLSSWGRKAAHRADISARLPEFVDLYGTAPAQRALA